MAMAIDPVCKMKVNESKPAAISEYKGKKYYFLDLFLQISNLILDKRYLLLVLKSYFYHKIS